MTYGLVVLALLVGLAGGGAGLWLCQRRGWLSLASVVEDGQDQLAFLVEGLRCLSGKSSAPCAKCGYVPASGASAEDVATARSALLGRRKGV